MSRNAIEFQQKPELPDSHYVDTRIYTDPEIFNEEKEKIFKKVWMIACHESELSNKYDYRTYQHPGGASLFVVRGEDMKIRCFYNFCTHRGNTLLYDPSGNAKHITCIFHLWSFDTQGALTDVTREKEGYQDRLCKEKLSLREVKTAIDFSGVVWVNLDDNCDSLESFIGGALDYLKEELSAEPLEVFHYHRAIVDTNHKLWHDTNSEIYHDFIHYHNRKTGMMQKGYFDRKFHCFPNGHGYLESMEMQYDAYEGVSGQRTLGWPMAAKACHKFIDLFPGITYNLRAPAFRLDSMIPLGPKKVMIEYRGLAPKSDTPEERQQRIKDYIGIWGPFGRNLHEDLLAVSGQERALEGVKSYLLHAREEGMNSHDEIGMRHFYAEWSRRMGRSSSNPYGDASAS
tara:strand:+ start:2743 stop:3942 length:1200 start_codon:yes stop_codon:yes gene_type:complete